MQQDEVGTKPILISPYSDGRHYGMSWWLDPSSSGAVTELSDAGVFGSTAWIDLRRHYGAFLMSRSDWATGQALWNLVKPLINAAIDLAQGTN
jgi:hypothetical protein